MKKKLLKLTAFLLILAGIFVSCKEKEVIEEPLPVEPTIELELGLYTRQDFWLDDFHIELIDKEKLAFRHLHYSDVFWNYEILKDSIKLTSISLGTHTYWFHVISSTEFEIEWVTEQFSRITPYKKSKIN